MKHLKGFRFFIMSALLFVFLAVGVSANEIAKGDISVFDSYEVVESYPVMNSSASDSFSYTIRRGGSSGTFVDRAESTSYDTISTDSLDPYRYDYMRVSISSGTFSLDAGKYYRFTGSLEFSYQTGAPTVSFVDDDDIVAYRISSGLKSSGTWGIVNYDIIYCPTQSKTFSEAFEVSFPTVDNYGPMVRFTPNSISLISEPVEQEKTVEEWLEDIFNTIKSGITGEGQEPPTSPGLTEDVGTAGEHQTVIEDIEQGVLSDFDASYEALDIGNFSLPVGVINALAWINYTWTGFFNMAGDLQYIVFVPCLVGLFLLIIGRGAMAMRSAMPRGRAPRPKEVEIKGGDDD
ncbi:hypothetical protein [Anaerotruncus rubiinfantis]|uniref:hypothetical protein n=1 Tax=Anaerotruncus rubiinfantis TaxID=1720200 RepID=UPI0034A2DFC5